ncbi:MAG TPA: hypothetical protein VN626_06535 [Clostridia bacterium]|nr:hypothetical protein [Clostridia bacterium]
MGSSFAKNLNHYGFASAFIRSEKVKHDCIGAHTDRWAAQEGSFHTDWAH